MIARVLAVLALWCAVAVAQPATEILRQGNEAARAGDWPRVTALVDPLLRIQLTSPDRAEANRLAGLAAYYQQRTVDADRYFRAYLELDLDGQLDPSLYPPDVVAFFNEVRIKHAAVIRSRRPKTKRYWLLTLIPPWGQIQNGERTKAYVVGGLLGAFAIGNVSTYLVLRSWCTRVGGPGGSSASCDGETDRSSSAAQLRAINILTGIGVIVTYAYGVYDGARGYRRRSREQSVQPYVTPTSSGGFVGIGGSF